MAPTTKPPLRRPLPPNRTYEQVLRHYEVETRLARRLLDSTPEERGDILATMYDELFAEVPDHPRLQQRDTRAVSDAVVAEKERILGEFLRPGLRFGEFGAGDCRLGFRVADRVEEVVGIDISNQIGEAEVPANFRLVLYDGERVPLPDGSLDVMFSDQLLEHIHPDDTPGHFREIHRLLRPGGAYIFRTPHRFTGPHDVSKYFGDEACGFHLKEWTYREIADVARASGFDRLSARYAVRGRVTPWPLSGFQAAEALLEPLPAGVRRQLARVLIHEVFAVAHRASD